jgi:hypothetical protein
MTENFSKFLDHEIILKHANSLDVLNNLSLITWANLTCIFLLIASTF